MVKPVALEVMAVTPVAAAVRAPEGSGAWTVTRGRPVPGVLVAPVAPAQMAQLLLRATRATPAVAVVPAVLVVSEAGPEQAATSVPVVSVALGGLVVRVVRQALARVSVWMVAAAAPAATLVMAVWPDLVRVRRLMMVGRVLLAPVVMAARGVAVPVVRLRRRVRLVTLVVAAATAVLAVRVVPRVSAALMARAVTVVPAVLVVREVPRVRARARA